MFRKKNSKKTHHLTKRAYVYMGLVTMGIVSLFAKPIKRGFSALEKHLANAACEEKEATLRRDLDLWTERRYSENINDYITEGKDPFDTNLEKEPAGVKTPLRKCRRHKRELD